MLGILKELDVSKLIDVSDSLNPGIWPGVKSSHLRYVASLGVPMGAWAEFGVWKGDSARYLLTLMPTNSKLHLFDSFEGLPTDWIPGYPAGIFACSPPVILDERVRMHIGLFSDTLRGFEEPLGFVHVDCDLYASAVDVFTGVGKLLVPGTLIVFDEFHLGESQAFSEWLSKSSFKATEISHTSYGQHGFRLS